MSKAAISIEGFVSNELEYRDAGSHRVVNVTVPVTPQKLVDGRWEDSGDTVWYEAQFWNEHADVVTQTVEKGTLVILTGTPELEVYAKRDGTPGGKIKIGNPVIAKVARRPKKGAGGHQQPASAPATEPWATAAPGAAQGAWEAPGAFTDETPF